MFQNNFTKCTIGILNQNATIDGQNVDQQNTRIITINNCDGPIDSFTGRITELSELSSKFNEYSIIVIHGVGGVGKTQLARKFAAVNKSNYNCVFWLQAEFQESLIKQLRELAVELAIEAGKNRNLNQIRNEIYDILKTQRALLIFDNTLNETEIQKYLPPVVTELKNTKLHILITSQFMDWNPTTVKCLPLVHLEKIYALELLNTILNNNRENAEDKEELVDKLEYMPLAIQIAASYINTQMKQNDGFTITRYIEKLSNNAANIHTRTQRDYGKTLDKSIKMSLDIIREDNSNAMEIIYLLAFLNPDSITKEVLLKILEINSKDAEDDFYESLQIIINYSLISSFNNILHLHRTIQEIIRDKLNEIDKRKFKECYKLVLDYVLNNEDQTSIPNSYVFKCAKDNTEFILQYYMATESAKLLRLLCEHGCSKLVQVIFTSLERNKVDYLIERHGLLHCATLSSDIETVKIICKYNIDVNMKYGNDNTTSLHISCMYGYVDIADLLIEEGADINMKCENGRIALHYASSGLHNDIVCRLLRISANNVEERDKKNLTPLQLVLNTHKTNENNNKTVQIARLLVENGANPETANDDSSRVIHIAAHNGNYEFLAYLLDNYKLDVNIKNKYGNTPLLYAVGACKFISEDYIMSTIKLLIKNGADVETINNSGSSLLHVASQFCHEKIISYLIQEHNISVNTRDNNGQSPLLCASLANKSISEDDVLATVKLLIANGADIETINNRGSCLLHIASEFCHEKIISYLIQEHNISVDTRDNDGHTPLFYALLATKSISEDDVLATVKLLITNGADVETINNRGSSLLHIASEFCHEKIISYLIQEHKISVDTRDNNDQSPLFYVLLANNSISKDDVLATVKLLITNGADVEIINNHGCSLLHIASEFCHEKIISYLIQEHNISVDTPDNDGRSPLVYALFANKSISEDDVLATVKLLITNEADVKTINNRGCSLMHAASQYCHEKVISYLIKEHNISVNTPDNNGHTPLFYALFANKSISEDDVLATVKLLITNGADVKTINNGGCSLMHAGSQFCHEQIISYLIEEHNISVDTPDIDGNSPLFCALLANKSISEDDVLTTVKLLITNRADVETINNRGCSLMHAASEFSYQKIISYLIQEQNVSVDTPDKNGHSPLFYSFYGNKSMSEDDVLATIKLLIAHGATVEATDNNGCTILHYGSQSGRYQALTYLLHNYNINIDTQDQEGNTPLHCALHADQSINQETVKNIIKKLLFKGASINLKNNNGQTALDLATPEIREFILTSYVDASKQ